MSRTVEGCSSVSRRPHIIVPARCSSAPPGCSSAVLLCEAVLLHQMLPCMTRNSECTPQSIVQLLRGLSAHLRLVAQRLITKPLFDAHFPLGVCWLASASRLIACEAGFACDAAHRLHTAVIDYTQLSVTAVNSVPYHCLSLGGAQHAWCLSPVRDSSAGANGLHLCWLTLLLRCASAFVVCARAAYERVCADCNGSIMLKTIAAEPELCVVWVWC